MKYVEFAAKKRSVTVGEARVAYLHIPDGLGHRFRRHLGTDSGALGHPFRTPGH